MSQTSDNQQLEEALQTNKKQQDFYDADPSSRKTNMATKLWVWATRRYYGLISGAGIWDDVHSLHLEWMGDLSGKKVLDLGCYSGNALSMTIARQCGEYVGVDLSTPATESLQQQLDKEGLAHARALAVDFLSPQFAEAEFDVCYAQGVLHHFKSFESMLDVLSSKLKDGGIVVSCDPLATPLVGRIARAAYRPFQLNKEWEWPFTKDTFDVLQRYFDIEAVQGFMGKSKRALPLAFFSPSAGVRTARRYHEFDLKEANKLGPPLWNCMQVIMLLRKKQE